MCIYYKALFYFEPIDNSSQEGEHRALNMGKLSLPVLHTLKHAHTAFPHFFCYLFPCQSQENF